MMSLEAIKDSKLPVRPVSSVCPEPNPRAVLRHPGTARNLRSHLDSGLFGDPSWCPNSRHRGGRTARAAEWPWAKGLHRAPQQAEVAGEDHSWRGSQIPGPGRGSVEEDVGRWWRRVVCKMAGAFLIWLLLYGVLTAGLCRMTLPKQSHPSGLDLQRPTGVLR